VTDAGDGWNWHRAEQAYFLDAADWDVRDRSVDERASGLRRGGRDVAPALEDRRAAYYHCGLLAPPLMGILMVVLARA